jgi:uncharacterized membrane protein
VSKRAPTNARYQKYQEPPGKTRKSAAAAKPSRKATSSSSSSAASKSKSSAGTKARFDPQTPEFKALRKRWWTLLVVGVVLVTLSWGVRYIDKPGNPLHDASFTLSSFTITYAGLLAAVTLGLAYACIFYALYLDFAKMRPMRLAAASGAKQAKPAKPADKPTKSVDKDSSTD